MTNNKRRGGKRADCDGVSSSAAQANMRASKAWLFLEHIVDSRNNSSGIDLSCFHEERGQHFVETPLSSAVTFFVLNFAQVTSSPSSPLFKTVFLNKSKKDGGEENCIQAINSGGSGLNLVPHSKRTY